MDSANWLRPLATVVGAPLTANTLDSIGDGGPGSTFTSNVTPLMRLPVARALHSSTVSAQRKHFSMHTCSGVQLCTAVYSCEKLYIHPLFGSMEAHFVGYAGC